MLSVLRCFSRSSKRAVARLETLLQSLQLCGLGGVEQGVACTQEAQQLLGSGPMISWVFHTLPCQGRVGVGGRGQEVQGAGRGNQLHESPRRPAADGQDTRRKRRFPWIRCRGQAGTSPWAQVVPGTAGCRAHIQVAEPAGEGGRFLPSTVGPDVLHWRRWVPLCHGTPLTTDVLHWARFGVQL